MSDTKQLHSQYIAHTYNRFDLEIVGGKGEIVQDDKGNSYIDMATGIAVNTFGHADHMWIEAVTAQINSFAHTSNLYYSRPCTELAQILCERTGMSKVFFSNSGAEANECAIKAARHWASVNKGSQYSTIITLTNSFHGRTITTLAATGQDTFHKDFLPLTKGFVYAPANDIKAMEKLVAENKVAAIMFETVQGEGGVNPLDKEYVTRLNSLAKENNILLICDEVQTGNGRTGKLYGYMHYGIQPDIVSTAKGLAGGLPIGATLLCEKLSDVYNPGMHGSTFGGNPVACAGGVEILCRLDEAFLQGVEERSAYIRKELEQAEGISHVTGLGLMLGFVPPVPAREFAEELLSEGVLVTTAKDKIRLLPPLNIPMDLLKSAVQTIKCCAASKGGTP